jgi:hypothetical protein
MHIENTNDTKQLVTNLKDSRESMGLNMLFLQGTKAC